MGDDKSGAGCERFTPSWLVAVAVGVGAVGGDDLGRFVGGQVGLAGSSLWVSGLAVGILGALLARFVVLLLFGRRPWS